MMYQKTLSNIQKRNNKVYTNEIDIAIATDTNLLGKHKFLFHRFQKYIIKCKPTYIKYFFI